MGFERLSGGSWTASILESDRPDLAAWKVTNFGSVAAADVAVVGLVATLILISFVTYRAIECPPRDWLNKLALSISAAVSSTIAERL